MDCGVMVRKTDHYKVMREFCDDPDGFVQAVIGEQGAVEWVGHRRT
jgi:hypothetical protein